MDIDTPMNSIVPTLQVTIVTVAYNSMAILPSMFSALPVGMPVVVVDNSPVANPALQKLCDQYRAQLVRNDRNRGFGTACNQGAALAETPFLLFLNPDTETEAGCIEALLLAAETYPNASAFNPRILDRRGKIAFRRHSKLRPRRERYRGPTPTADQELPVLSGAAFFVAKAKFDRVGGFDEAIFLFYEDDDLALRLSSLGPLMHIQNAVVRHLEGHSTKRSPETAYFKAYHLARSRVFAKTKHELPWPKAGVVFRGVRQLFSPLMLNRRKRWKYFGYMAGALSTLRDNGRHIG